MPGSNKPRVIPTERDYDLFQYLAEAKLLTREQIQRLIPFGSVARINQRLLQLHNAGFLLRYFLGTEAGGRKALYALAPKTAPMIALQKFWKLQRANDELLVGEAFVEHQLAINDCWISLKAGTGPKLERFLRFSEPLSQNIPLVPDSYAELDSTAALQPVFLEVDLGTESSRVWDRKVSLYLKLALSGEFERRFGQSRFKVAVVCTSERRLQNLRQIVRKHTDKIFRFNLLSTTNREGFSAPHWLRPAGDQREALA